MKLGHVERAGLGHGGSRILMSRLAHLKFTNQAIDVLSRMSLGLDVVLLSLRSRHVATILGSVLASLEQRRVGNDDLVNRLLARSREVGELVVDLLKLFDRIIESRRGLRGQLVFELRVANLGSRSGRRILGLRGRIFLDLGGAGGIGVLGFVFLVGR